MKNFKVLGSGCKNCAVTADLITKKASDLGIEIELEKITDMAAIMGYGVMSTPSVVLDETVVHSGGVPAGQAIEGWLKA